MRTLLALAAALALAGCASNTATETTTAPEDAPGLRVGDAAPDVTLVNADGEPVTLQSLYAEGPVVVTFYRGGWCPFCNRALKDWATRVDEVEAAGAAFVAVTPESPDNYAKTISRNELNYTVLGDPELDAARAFDILHTLSDDEQTTYKSYNIDVAAANSSGTWELPAPGTFVIDADGVIRFAFADYDYIQRADPDDVIAAVQSLQ